MKLEVGMYSRTRLGIGKIIVVFKENAGVKFSEFNSMVLPIVPVNFLKASYDILDLIENDDIVVLQYKNKYGDVVSRKFEISRIKKEYIDFTNSHANWIYDRKTKSFVDDFGLGQPIIKQVMTHEQFEQGSYKIGG